ncbi:MAG TPA: hypothetical protein VLJ11_07855 [Bryobacteraceae bacterium]|nr:hypothetical protein [Bryobacteraceae bacterium]
MTTSKLPTINMKARRFATTLQYSMITTALVLISVCPSRTLAQDGHLHTQTTPQQEMTPDQIKNAGALLKIVRDSTERFKDVAVAEAEGYALQFGCVSGDYSGAMGLHYVNGALVNSGVLDATRPQIVIYEPTPGGGLRLTGADYLLLADAWNAKHSGPPELMGQLFHLFDSPNRFGLPPFYTLHVWAWKPNPNGAFVNWHPNVSCQSFAGQTP